MYPRIIKHSKEKSFFLFGPRGTGKTTRVKSSFPQAVFIDLLESEVYNDLLANPQRLERFIPRDFKKWIIIDEVQRIPAIEVKRTNRITEQMTHGLKTFLKITRRQKLIGAVIDLFMKVRSQSFPFRKHYYACRRYFRVRRYNIGIGLNLQNNSLDKRRKRSY